MSKIHRLSAHEAQKIAAGQVVDRPANVVKELLENAIDAGANKITLHIEDAGKQLIRVVDNGCGMDVADANLCFEHHATSKIKSINDLAKIQTFGFRGEALSSIAAVSKITLITKEDAASEGTKLELEGGQIYNQELVTANTGTDISVQNLFYNVPARKKFLKSSATELRHIQYLLHALCFDYLHIHFKLISQEEHLLNCPPVTTLSDRISQLWEDNVATHMVPLQPSSSDAVNIHGIISNHQFMRYDRNSILFFVNSRWVKHQKLVSSLLKGYLNVLPPARYPAACIFIDVDPNQVDINIHPRKEEVQFLHPHKVETALQKAVKETLEMNLSSQLKKPITFAPAVEIMPSAHSILNHLHFVPKHKSSNVQHHSFEQHTILNTRIKEQKDNSIQMQDSLPQAPEISPHIDAAQHERVHDEDLSPIIAQESYHDSYTIIGQFSKTYILIEKEEGLMLIDQHAAHERILYEIFSKRFSEIATVKLLFPQTITLNSDAIAILASQLELFRSNGIEIQIMSDNQIMIISTPVHLKNQSLEDLIHAVISWVSQNDCVDKDQFLKAINEKIHAQMACKAAVKAGDSMTEEQITQLISDLYKTDNRFTCPHGRPTIWTLSLHEIEKKFKRKL
jgi:DNA mismatch repair protein MutL